MKKVKLLTTLLLSGASIAALASCGTNTYPGANKPGVSVLLDSEDSSKYISYEVEGGEENLKFGETDVVVNVTPNKFYSFYEFINSKDGEGTNYWGRSGCPADQMIKSTFSTNVYLGSRNAVVRYKLAENVAWTITNNSTFDDVVIDGQPWKLVKEEKFQIKVKKEFFQKAISINFNVYNEDRHTLVSTYRNVFSPKNNGCVVASSDLLDETVKFNTTDSDFTVLNDNNALVLVYDINSTGGKKLNAENKNIAVSKLKNELLSFNGYDQLDKDKKYSKFEVIGVKKSDHTDETLSVYDPKKKEQDFAVEVANAGNRIIFYLKWTSLIDAIPGDPYNEKYEDFKIKLTPSPILDVKVTYSATKDDYKMQDGFFNKYKEDDSFHLHNFSRGEFYLQYDGTNEPRYFNDISVTSKDLNDKTAPYFIFVKGKESPDGNPTWPTVDIDYEDVNGKILTKPIGTTVKESTDNEIKYCENDYWRIICINSGRNESIVDPWGNKANNMFVIYPLYSTGSFYMPDGGAYLAKSVTINVGNI